MGIFAAGQVVIVHFPFSDLSQSKLRPALVLADAGRGDWRSAKSPANPMAIQGPSRSWSVTLFEAYCEPPALRARENCSPRTQV
jgi:hypothetical protein